MYSGAMQLPSLPHQLLQQRITSFYDDEVRSRYFRGLDFAGPQGMQGFLQKFLANPTQDMVAYQKSIQDYWDQLPPLT